MLKRLHRELKEVEAKPQEWYKAGPLARLDQWVITVLGPVGTPYEGWEIDLIIDFPENYPFRNPCPKFCGPIKSPFVGPTGGLCCCGPKDAWHPAKKGVTIVEWIGELLKNPDPDSEDRLFCACTLDEEVADLYRKDPSAFGEVVRDQMEGRCRRFRVAMPCTIPQGTSRSIEVELLGYSMFGDISFKLVGGDDVVGEGVIPQGGRSVSCEVTVGRNAQEGPVKLVVGGKVVCVEDLMVSQNFHRAFLIAALCWGSGGRVPYDLAVIMWQYFARLSSPSSRPTSPVNTPPSP